MVRSEGTPGTYATPDENYAKRFTKNSLRWDDAGQGPLQRESVEQHFDMLPPAANPQLAWAIRCQHELLLSTGATTAPDWGWVPIAGGMSETISADVIYEWLSDPVSAANEASFSLLIEDTTDGNDRHGNGYRCGFEIVLQQGRRNLISHQGFAQYNDPAASSGPTGITQSDYNAGVPSVGFSVLTLGGANIPVASRVIIRSGVRAALRESQDSASHYYKWPCVIDRVSHVTVELVAEARDETAFAYWSKYKGATAGDLVVTATNGTRSIDITVRAATVGKRRTQRVNGRDVWTLPLIGGIDSSDNSSLKIRTY